MPSDDPPAYGFGRAGKRMGEWTVQCEPGPRGVSVAMRADLPMDTWDGALQWYDPRDGSRGEVPEVSAPADEPRATAPWRPGLGGVLILDLGAGDLYLAAI